MSASKPAATEPITWRIPIWARGPYAVGNVIVLAALVVVTVLKPAQPYTWSLLAVFAFVTVGAWRQACTLGATTLHAQGRFAHRDVELADLQQVGQGLNGIWVQTHHPLDKRGGTVLYLRMIPITVGSLTRKPSGLHAVDVIRERAAAAGAELDPPLPGPHRPHSKKPLFFSI